LKTLILCSNDKEKISCIIALKMLTLGYYYISIRYLLTVCTSEDFFLFELKKIVTVKIKIHKSHTYFLNDYMILFF